MTSIIFLAAPLTQADILTPLGAERGYLTGLLFAGGKVALHNCRILNQTYDCQKPTAEMAWSSFRKAVMQGARRRVNAEQRRLMGAWKKIAGFGLRKTHQILAIRKTLDKLGASDNSFASRRRQELQRVLVESRRARRLALTGQLEPYALWLKNGRDLLRVANERERAVWNFLDLISDPIQYMISADDTRFSLWTRQVITELLLVQVLAKLRSRDPLVEVSGGATTWNGFSEQRRLGQAVKTAAQKRLYNSVINVGREKFARHRIRSVRLRLVKEPGIRAAQMSTGLKPGALFIDLVLSYRSKDGNTLPPSKDLETTLVEAARSIRADRFRTHNDRVPK